MLQYTQATMKRLWIKWLLHALWSRIIETYDFMYDGNECISTRSGLYSMAVYRSYTAMYSPSLISKTLGERHSVCTTGHFWGSRCEHQLHSISCVSKTLNLDYVILSPICSESWSLMRVKFQFLASWWGFTRWWIPAPSPTTTSYFWLPFFLRFSSPPCSLNPKSPDKSLHKNHSLLISFSSDQKISWKIDHL
jgi:hypothetical protein